ncbi:eukaryotic translation initiation factor 4E member 2 [Fomitiporia mediterranea MF3/22]|uniref:eukaryotic translation initiation factor 4E member 2 n=1 Tax=Fomitiporia mediterranea (strain MF3/22) TaxID=694068 RepID=UPI00044090FA|nr:eukaryotic translation initiation factor 4E member 2 [Fomitiporia mediterranea MF3/22]EJD07608.1 eukaryotic translation initiation factor 4E member 2 [Fomitiporia mediterranea MF3/22]
MTTAAISQKPSARPRAPSSRHFSTSVSTNSSGDEKPSTKEKHAMNAGSNGSNPESLHPLRNTWVFWFRQQRSPGNKIINYEEGIKKIAAFASIESFWMIWTHLNPPSTVQPTTDYLLFHSGVRRPVWEDPLNSQGGKWIIRLKKGVADRLWEELVLAVIGDQFDDCGLSTVGGFGGTASGAADVSSWRSVPSTENSGSGNGNGTSSNSNDPEICGCTLSVRQHEDILTVWNKHGYDTRVNQRIKDAVKRVLELPANTVIEYKTNNDSLQDKSSFRQPNTDKTAIP